MVHNVENFVLLALLPCQTDVCICEIVMLGKNTCALRHIVHKKDAGCMIPKAEAKQQLSPIRWFAF